VGNKDTPSASSYFIPLQEKYWDYLGFSKTNSPNRKNLSFSRKDGDMLVMNHTSNGTNSQKKRGVGGFRVKPPIFYFSTLIPKDKDYYN
jgi:hypothetical protein